MNHYKLLSHTENGYITRCNNCKLYRLAFGTTMIQLSKNELTELRQEVIIQLELYPHQGFHDQKIIQIPIPTPVSCLILNYTELTKLADMLTEVNLMEAVEAFLF